MSKLQYVQREVTFLGHIITKDGKSLSKKRVEAIQKIPKPQTKKQLLLFLGTCSYCRTFIPNYAIEEAPLRALAHTLGLRPHDRLTWSDEATLAFETLKKGYDDITNIGAP